MENIVQQDSFALNLREKLPGDYIAGFVDGEGCFALKLIKSVRHERPNKPEYIYWDICFTIVLRGDDVNILEQIRDTLECGKIVYNKKGDAYYTVQTLSDLSGCVVPFFDKHVLRAKKRFDFKLWKEALLIFMRNRQVRTPGARGFSKIAWDENDRRRLVGIHEEMKQYKSKVKEWKWIAEAKQYKA